MVVFVVIHNTKAQRSIPYLGYYDKQNSAGIKFHQTLSVASSLKRTHLGTQKPKKNLGKKTQATPSTMTLINSYLCSLTCGRTPVQSVVEVIKK